MVGLTLFFLPKLTRRLLKKELPISYLKNRLGLGLSAIKKENRGAFWFHAVSLGEMKGLFPLVSELRKQHSSTPFIFSTSTITGYNEAKKIFPGDALFFLPIDFSFLIKPLVSALQPKFLFFSETDLWYHLLQASHACHATNIILSAKLSEKSSRWYRFISSRLFGYIDLICCQNDTYRDRFLSIHVPALKLKVTGNLKYDMQFPQFTEELAVQECLVLGSTHPKEEEQLLDNLPLDRPIVIVPRHPNRFDEVADLLKKRGAPFVRWSQSPNCPAQLILVDAMGKLMQFYSAASLAIVAGSYQPIGGHNILEPLAYGTPVLFGPHMHTQFELVDLVLNAKAGLQVPLDKLRETVDHLLHSPAELKRMGDNGKKLIASLQGVTARTLKEIYQFANPLNHSP